VREELRAEIERLREEREQESAAAGTKIEELLERVERDRERQEEAAREELAAALERIEQVRREAERLREQVTEVQVEKAEAEGLSGDDRRRLEALQRESAEAQARLDALRELADERSPPRCAPSWPR
jgi:predicted  nucleic acid-binding Zn-ribbon protein